MKESTSLEGVPAARRQPLIAGVNLAGTTGVVVSELDPHDKGVHRGIFPGDYVRLIRQTRAGTYLMSCNDRIREGSPQGEYRREFPAEGLYHAWKAVRLSSGNLLVFGPTIILLALFINSVRQTNLFDFVNQLAANLLIPLARPLIYGL